jgi:hypothetical protein
VSAVEPAGIYHHPANRSGYQFAGTVFPGLRPTVNRNNQELRKFLNLRPSSHRSRVTGRGRTSRRGSSWRLVPLRTTRVRLRWNSGNATVRWKHGVPLFRDCRSSSLVLLRFHVSRKDYRIHSRKSESGQG